MSALLSGSDVSYLEVTEGPETENQWTYPALLPLIRLINHCKTFRNKGDFSGTPLYQINLKPSCK